MLRLRLTHCLPNSFCCRRFRFRTSLQHLHLRSVLLVRGELQESRVQACRGAEEQPGAGRVGREEVVEQDILHDILILHLQNYKFNLHV